MTPLDALEAPRLLFVLEGQPIPKARPRVGKNGHFYTPTTTVQYEKKIAVAAAAARARHAAVTGKIWPMSAAYYYVQLAIFKRSNAVVDGDNVFKSVADAMLKTLFTDDGGVTGFFHPPIVDARPRIEVVVVAYDASLLHWEPTVRSVVEDQVRRARVRHASSLMLRARPDSYEETQAWTELVELVREGKQP